MIYKAINNYQHKVRKIWFNTISDIDLAQDFGSNRRNLDPWYH